jgi:hypothetical protein
VCCVAQLLVVLDSSIMTVALPSVAVDLELGPDALPWVVNAFAILTLAPDADDAHHQLGYHLKTRSAGSAGFPLSRHAVHSLGP